MFSLQWTMQPYYCYKAYKQHLHHIQCSWGIIRDRMWWIRGLQSGNYIRIRLSTKLFHYDLFYTLHQFIKASLLYWKFCYVKGQQDNGDTYNNIDEWGRMNVEADRRAKDYMWCQIYAGATNQPHESISGDIWPTTMEYHNVPYTITSHFSKKLKKIISKHLILKYWSSHNIEISNELTDMSVFQHTEIIYQYGSNCGCQSGHVVCVELVNFWNIGNSITIKIAPGAW